MPARENQPGAEARGERAGFRSHAWGGPPPRLRDVRSSVAFGAVEGEEHQRGSREKRDNWRPLDDFFEGLCFCKEQRKDFLLEVGWGQQRDSRAGEIPVRGPLRGRGTGQGRKGWMALSQLPLLPELGGRPCAAGRPCSPMGRGAKGIRWPRSRLHRPAAWRVLPLGRLRPRKGHEAGVRQMGNPRRPGAGGCGCGERDEGRPLSQVWTEGREAAEGSGWAAGLWEGMGGSGIRGIDTGQCHSGPTGGKGWASVAGAPSALVSLSVEWNS